MAGGELGEGGGPPGLRIDVIELGRLDQAGDEGPVLAAVVRAGEQSVLLVERERRMARSTQLLSTSTRPSSKNRGTLSSSIAAHASSDNQNRGILTSVATATVDNLLHLTCLIEFEA